MCMGSLSLGSPSEFYIPSPRGLRAHLSVCPASGIIPNVTLQRDGILKMSLHLRYIQLITNVSVYSGFSREGSASVCGLSFPQRIAANFPRSCPISEPAFFTLLWGPSPHMWLHLLREDLMSPKSLLSSRPRHTDSRQAFLPGLSSPISLHSHLKLNMIQGTRITHHTSTLPLRSDFLVNGTR